VHDNFTNISTLWRVATFAREDSTDPNVNTIMEFPFNVFQHTVFPHLTFSFNDPKSIIAILKFLPKFKEFISIVLERNLIWGFHCIMSEYETVHY
jgi:hypothetical protein